MSAEEAVVRRLLGRRPTCDWLFTVVYAKGAA